VLKYAFTLKRMAKHLPKDFEKLNEEEFSDYIAYLEISNLSDWTKPDYKVALKKFYKWLNGGEEPLTVKYTDILQEDRSEAS
jgi:integrase/recombinase XerD